MWSQSQRHHVNLVAWRPVVSTPATVPARGQHAASHWTECCNTAWQPALAQAHPLLHSVSDLLLIHQSYWQVTSDVTPHKTEALPRSWFLVWWYRYLLPHWQCACSVEMSAASFLQPNRNNFINYLETHVRGGPVTEWVADEVCSQWKLSSRLMWVRVERYRERYIEREI